MRVFSVNYGSIRRCLRIYQKRRVLKSRNGFLSNDQFLSTNDIGEYAGVFFSLFLLSHFSFFFCWIEEIWRRTFRGKRIAVETAFAATTSRISRKRTFAKSTNGSRRPDRGNRVMMFTACDRYWTSSFAHTFVRESKDRRVETPHPNPVATLRPFRHPRFNFTAGTRTVTRTVFLMPPLNAK